MRYIGILPGNKPAGNNTEIQYNDNGAFGASSNLTFDGTNLSITGNIKSTGNLTQNGADLFEESIETSFFMVGV